MSTTIPDSIHPSDLPEIGQPLADGTFFARQWLNGNGSAPSQSPVRLRHIPTLPLFARLRPGFFHRPHSHERSPSPHRQARRRECSAECR